MDRDVSSFLDENRRAASFLLELPPVVSCVGLLFMIPKARNFCFALRRLPPGNLLISSLGSFDAARRTEETHVAWGNSQPALASALYRALQVTLLLMGLLSQVVVFVTNLVTCVTSTIEMPCATTISFRLTCNSPLAPAPM